eukprot:CAMPEP_0119375458 /NCGR_PEP_ID=MMETSP1334-20130426/36048_1 /TAXON_ID=127549 /ORGANISM="Calcidiscus leptoporus, Strain RCC1130" /LENGTH=34 /DNA_ID= /DNA_START= /DNA_END= /DNA_ORIENTATION=
MRLADKHLEASLAQLAQLSNRMQTATAGSEDTEA